MGSDERSFTRLIFRLGLLYRLSLKEYQSLIKPLSALPYPVLLGKEIGVIKNSWMKIHQS